MDWRTAVRAGIRRHGGGNDERVIRYAVDRGVNYVDTADCNMGGENELYRMLGGDRGVLPCLPCGSCAVAAGSGWT